MRASPVVALLGARQVGKSTLARELAESSPGDCILFDLENPRDVARLADPLLALEGLRGLVIIDEVQPVPELFRVLRVLADRPRRPARFLVLGSASVEGHPKLGASWEGFVLEEVVKQLGVEPEQCYFWATHAGAELGLLVVHGRSRLGFEFKRTASRSLSRSMRIAMADLGLTRLDVLHAGNDTFALASDVRAVTAGRLTTDIPLLNRPHRRTGRTGAPDPGSRSAGSRDESAAAL